MITLSGLRISRVTVLLALLLALMAALFITQQKAHAIGSCGNTASIIYTNTDVSPPVAVPLGTVQKVCSYDQVTSVATVNRSVITTTTVIGVWVVNTVTPSNNGIRYVSGDVTSASSFPITQPVQANFTVCATLAGFSSVLNKSVAATACTTP